MKKIYLGLFASALGMTAHAQTLTQASHAPATGDMYGTIQCDSLNINPGPAGAGVNWNFSSLVLHNSVVANYTTMASTTPGYPAGVLSTAAGVNDQIYTMSSASDLRYYGGNFKVQSVIGTFVYGAPATIASYPMSLNTTSTAPVSGTVNISSPFPISGTFSGNSAVVADGSGTLTLPGGALGTYSNVLRVVTTQTLNYTASLANGVVTKVNYDYYTPSIKASLLSIAMFTMTSNVSATASQTLVTINKDYLQSPPVSVGLNENTASAIALQVYPNPAVSQVVFSTDSKLAGAVRIFDMTGRLVEAKPMHEGSLKLDVSGYQKGVYLYSVLNNSGETLKSGKLTVN